MTDYSEHGALPVEDAATDDPPTVEEVMDRQRREYPSQSATSTLQAPMSEEERATIEAGGKPVELTDDHVGIEGPNTE